MDSCFVVQFPVDSSYFPSSTFHLTFYCGLHQSRHTGVIPQISPFFQRRQRRHTAYYRESSSLQFSICCTWGRLDDFFSHCLPNTWVGQQTVVGCTPSPPPKLSFYLNTKAPAISLHIRKRPLQTSPWHRQQSSDCCQKGFSSDYIQTTHVVRQFWQKPPLSVNFTDIFLHF